MCAAAATLCTRDCTALCITRPGDAVVGCALVDAEGRRCQ